MSARRWKRTRNDLRPTQRALDRRERAKYRLPWLLRLAALLWPRVRARHRERWERIHRAGLRSATHRISHAIARRGL